MSAGLAMGLSTGANVLGGLFGASEEKKALENQAQALEARADSLDLEGFAQETAIRRQKDAVIGQTVSAAAGSGVDVTTGSVLDVIEDSAFNIEMDAMTMRNTYANQATALRQEAANTRAAKPSGLSTLLGAAGTAAGGYAKYKMFKG
ncbi:coil containing protein [Vibrio phage 1.182.O._10N.286.46.E1]|nr:coil containing protein [Vibrio phage 1.182.O._10N.286.46.E1]